MNTQSAPIILTLALLLLASTSSTVAQNGGGHTLYGDLKVDESKATGLKPLSFDLILYTTGGGLLARQTVANNSRYRFNDVPSGDYDLVVEVENTEIARIRLNLNEAFKTDIRHDVELEYRENLSDIKPRATTTAANAYQRSATNKKRLAQAEVLIDQKKYSEALVVLHQILNDDDNDYEVWTELGTAYLMQQELGKAEGAYERAGETNRSFFPSFFNLGKLRMDQKRFALAIEPLNQAIKIKPDSAPTNYLLGEAYLQLKQGSKAVIYFNEALRLDPVGMAQAHLRLAMLYNAVGMKNKAAEEYEAFLKKKPDYPARKVLEQYISENKKQ